MITMWVVSKATVVVSNVPGPIVPFEFKGVKSRGFIAMIPDQEAGFEVESAVLVSAKLEFVRPRCWASTLHLASSNATFRCLVAVAA